MAKQVVCDICGRVDNWDGHQTVSCGTSWLAEMQIKFRAGRRNELYPESIDVCRKCFVGALINSFDVEYNTGEDT